MLPLLPAESVLFLRDTSVLALGVQFSLEPATDGPMALLFEEETEGFADRELEHDEAASSPQLEAPPISLSLLLSLFATKTIKGFLYFSG